MKKGICMILVLILLVLTVSCSNVSLETDSYDDIISPENKGETSELTIVMRKDEYTRLQQEGFLKMYINRFEENFGVKVNFKIIGQESQEYGTLIDYQDINDYTEKILAILNSKDGFELIYSETFTLDTLAQDTVVNLRGKIPNVEKIYDSLLADEVYYAPVAIAYPSKGLNKGILENLQIEAPGLNWTSEDYYLIRDKWLSQNSIYFNSSEYLRITDRYLKADDIIDLHKNTSLINTTNIKDKIMSIIDEIFSGKYKLFSEYTYKNYHNMLYDEYSDENKKSFELFEKSYTEHLEYSGGFVNLLRAKDTDKLISKNSGIILPQFSDRSSYLYSYGFFVNKNGKNLELAYEFINGLLSDDMQMQMYTDWGKYYPFYYPISKDIENQIMSLDENAGLDPKAIELKKFAIEDIKAGNRNLSTEMSEKVMILYYMFKKDILEIIFADNKYTDAQLEAELQKLQNKYDAWLRE